MSLDLIFPLVGNGTFIPLAERLKAYARYICALGFTHPKTKQNQYAVFYMILTDNRPHNFVIT